MLYRLGLFLTFILSITMGWSVGIEPNSSFEAQEITPISYEGRSPYIGYIAIEDRDSGINPGTWLYVKQALKAFQENPPAFVVLKLNTPGGEVLAAQKISDALKELDTQYHIPVVAYIDNWAISAGAMIAYACRYIAVTKDGSMGAAEPVYAGAEGEMKTASEKVNSALRSDFENRASFFNRNPILAEAMVDKDIIVVERDGKILKLDYETQIISSGSNPDKIISNKGKLLTLNARELMEYKVADFYINPISKPSITAEEKSNGAWPFYKMQLAQLPFFQPFKDSVIKTYQMDWKTQFFVFLATPWVSSLLLMGLLLGFYLEITSPGVGFPGTLAVFCLIFIVLSSFSLEIASYLELIFVLTGALLLIVDLLFLPTFGLFGSIGVLFFIGGLFSLMLPGPATPDYTWQLHGIEEGGYFFSKLLWMIGSLLVSIVLIVFLAFKLPAFSGLKRLVLKGGEQEPPLPEPNVPPVGTIAVALTPLRQSGKIIIESNIVDALSDGPFIEKGKKVRVIRIEGGIPIVSEIPIESQL